MNRLNIGGLIAKLPIIQGGMGICVSLSGLASAVANEGGIGVISAVGIGMLEPNYRKRFHQSNKISLRKEIRKAREKSDGVIGVNIMMAITDFDDMLKIALEENVDVIFIGAGLFLKKPEIPEGCNT
ncbi:MAG: nitronate monooxygenase, partial [Dysgonamonadaceae bacterium]